MFVNSTELKRFIICILFLLIIGKSHAQSWPFAERYLSGNGGNGTSPYSITTDDKGNGINTGYFQDTIAIGLFVLRFPQSSAICSYVSKFSSSGTPLWVTGIYPGKNSTGRVFSYTVGADPLGDIYIAGIFSDTIIIGNNSSGYAVNPSASTDAYFLARLDANGNVIWLKTGAYSPMVSYTLQQALVVDKNSNVYISGLFENNLTFGSYTLNSYYGKSSVFLVKYDGNGNVLWAKQSKSPNQNLSSLAVTWPGIALDNQDNIFVSGSFNDSVLFDNQVLYCKYSNGENMFLVKYDGNTGNVLWARSPDSHSSNGGINGWANMLTRASLATDSYGNVYVASNFYDTLSFGPYSVIEYCTRTSGRYGGAFVVKYSGSGSPIWAESVKTKKPTQSCTAFALCSDGWNNLYLAGETEDSSLSFGGLTLGPNPWQPYFIYAFDTGGHATCGALLNDGLRYINLAASPIVPSVYVNADLYGGTIFGKDTLHGTFNSSFLAEFECDTCKMHSHFSGNTTICRGQSDVITVSASGASYIWSNGNYDSTITISPINTTVYSVYYANGTCYGDTNITVTVLPVPTASITAKQSICVGDSATITASGGALYAWSNGDSTATIVVKPNVSIEYSVVVSNGTCSAKDSSSVTVYNMPVPNVSNTQTICAGTSATLSVSGGSGYKWSNGDTTTTIMVSPNSTATYSVNLYNGPCSVKDSVSVVVHPIPSPTISPTQNICTGNSAVLSATGGSLYLWNNGDTTSSITVAPTTSVTYSVSVSNGFCKINDSVQVVVSNYPIPVINNAGSVCAGKSITIAVSGGSHYIWSTGVATASITVTPTINTTYSVTLYNGACSVNDSATVIVNPLPLTTACCDTTIAFGKNVQLTSSGGSTYLWSPSNGLSCNTCFDPIASPTVNTTYTLTVTSDSGCTTQQTITIDVNCGTIFIPDAFSPNNDGQNDYLYVRGDCIKILQFEIFDRWGNKVFETTDKNIPWNGMFNGKAANTGAYMYYLSATLYDGTTQTKKGNVALVR